MYNKRINFAIENFIEEKYFEPMDSNYLLKEEDDSGKSELNVQIDKENLSNQKCGQVI